MCSTQPYSAYVARPVYFAGSVVILVRRAESITGPILCAPTHYPKLFIVVFRNWITVPATPAIRLTLSLKEQIDKAVDASSVCWRNGLFN